MEKKHNSYEDNAYHWLKRKGLAEKYEHPGIYCIKVDDEIVYIGKSHNMLKRVAQHYVGIQKQSNKKYRILAEAQRKGHQITFDVLYYAQEGYYSAVTDEIGFMEGVYIREHTPILNTQIPKAENWHLFEVNKVDAKSILKDMLNGAGDA